MPADRSPVGTFRSARRGRRHGDGRVWRRSIGRTDSRGGEEAVDERTTTTADERTRAGAGRRLWGITRSGSDAGDRRTLAMRRRQMERGTALTALVTPFDKNGALALEILPELIAFQREGGIDGLVICGTNGEG